MHARRFIRWQLLQFGLGTVLVSLAFYKHRHRSLLAPLTAVVVERWIQALQVPAGERASPVVIVLFDAEECPAVLATLATLNEMWKAGAIQLLAVAIGDNAGSARQTLEREGLPLPLQELSEKSARAFLRTRNIRRLPVLFLRSEEQGLRKISLNALGADAD